MDGRRLTILFFHEHERIPRDSLVRLDSIDRSHTVREPLLEDVVAHRISGPHSCRRTKWGFQDGVSPSEKQRGYEYGVTHARSSSDVATKVSPLE